MHLYSFGSVSIHLNNYKNNGFDSSVRYYRSSSRSKGSTLISIVYMWPISIPNYLGVNRVSLIILVIPKAKFSRRKSVVFILYAILFPQHDHPNSGEDFTCIIHIIHISDPEKYISYSFDYFHTSRPIHPPLRDVTVLIYANGSISISTII